MFHTKERAACTDACGLSFVLCTCLVTFSVEFFYGKSGEIHIGETTHIDGYRLLPVVVCSVTECLYSAGFAEKMVDMLFIKEVLGEVIFSGKERELFFRDKGE